ncbi:hypothetical protein JXA40_11970 [bacterium]|nr:hypothetical protein [candidate division CSSED10-310 bacterium]
MNPRLPVVPLKYPLNRLGMYLGLLCAAAAVWLGIAWTRWREAESVRAGLVDEYRQISTAQSRMADLNRFLHPVQIGTGPPGIDWIQTVEKKLRRSSLADAVRELVPVSVRTIENISLTELKVTLSPVEPGEMNRLFELMEMQPPAVRIGRMTAERLVPDQPTLSVILYLQLISVGDPGKRCLNSVSEYATDKP